MSPSEKKKQIKEIQAALDRFPEVVAQKKRRYIERQKFLKATFGDLVKQLEREIKNRKKK